MLNQISLSDVRTFVLIAQRGNFTKAADALNVSRSHVSRQIASLEKKMGVTLLIRTTRTMRLTEAGQALFDQCQRSFENINQALLAAVDQVENIQGEIRINCVGGYLGEELVAEITTLFMHKYPDVRIKLDFSSHRIDLIDDDFDLAFRMGKLDDAGFIARPLLAIKMGTLASPSYLQQSGTPQHPKELLQHQCLTGSVTKWNFENDTDSQHYDVLVNSHLQCKNGRVLVKGAIKGNGIVRIPLIYCQQALERGELVEVFEQWTIPSVDFSVIYHSDRFMPKRFKRFIDFVVDYFAAYSK
ncbi:LysR family transcriptional regulator [Vibrio ostreicida]|uniref:LysR family transcriptional regulator n=1 Tax=Vibrio ostreicida TaxID=526588 RepID=A0ABT8C005_9VIBR|nr:LysR family transcriptional regulator [Vibrio ostreicida]MDN3612294.1 LysR family transcriptional regulator [Vibrio ostreicida]NPD08677.1 LysR family transcriptional regulator [Vibrio ostreicida]